MLGLGSARFVSVQLSGFSGRNQDRSDRDRSWLWQRETGLEPATSTLGRCRSVLEFRRAPITAAGCLSTPIFEGGKQPSAVTSRRWLPGCKSSCVDCGVLQDQVPCTGVNSVEFSQRRCLPNRGTPIRHARAAGAAVPYGERHRMVELVRVRRPRRHTWSVVHTGCRLRLVKAARRSSPTGSVVRSGMMATRSAVERTRLICSISATARCWRKTESG